MTCHTNAFGPQLTAFGRTFKLNGYVMGGGDWNYPPLSGMLVTSFNNTEKGQPGGAAQHFNNNNNFALDQTSVFYAGQVFGKLGAFIQGTYDGIAREFLLDTADIRLADQDKLFGGDISYGVSVNNNPTTQDLWNTTPAWGFPYQSSGLAPTPTASPLIAGGVSQQVVGGTLYGFWNDLLYVEFGGYTTLQKSWQQAINSFDSAENEINGVAPYWRVALQQTLGNHYLEVGTFGLHAPVYPSRVTTAGTDKLTDAALDATYEYSGLDPHVLRLQTTFIHENQDLSASRRLGLANNSSNDLESYQILGQYTYDQTYQLNLQYFNTWGSRDTGLYSPGSVSGSANGRPDSDGFVTEVVYTPFGKDDSLYSPWLNVRLALQYVAYLKFNGRQSNYDGSGRSASDNNTIYANLWLAY